MIQRVQTVWLLLAAIAGFLTTRVPLFAGTLAGEVVKKFDATESLLLFAVAIIGALFALIAVFLFRNRKSQMKFTGIGIMISIALIALEVWQIGEFEKSNSVLKGGYYWGALLPIAMMVFFILAAVNIRKDNKLVKSLDRLR
jgi:FtsH-binding integral membrane protein